VLFACSLWAYISFTNAFVKSEENAMFMMRGFSSRTVSLTGKLYDLSYGLNMSLARVYGDGDGTMNDFGPVCGFVYVCASDSR
jgi:hypothetical protein